MKFKRQLADATGLPERILPASYQAVGDICLLKLSPEARPHAAEIGRAILRLYPRFKTVCEIEQIAGQFRQPKVRVIAGDGTTTIHRELGCAFALDVAQIMWSKGNLPEKKRLIKLVQPGEVIVDMFAGIGYWTIPIAKHTAAAKIYAIELNPAAYDYLCKNIRLNRLTNVVPIAGDCATEAPKLGRIADRVIMGLLPNPSDYVDAALACAKEGAIVHFHCIAPDEQSARSKANFGKLKKVVKVKSYAPRIWHWVLDVVV